MFLLDGITVLADVQTVIEDLKFDLNASGIMKLSDIKPTNNNIMVSCPHHRNGLEHNASCGISLTEVRRNGKVYPAGTCNCMTCGYTADLPSLVAYCWGTNDREYGKRYILRKYNTMNIAERPDIKLDFKRTRLGTLPYNYIDESELDKYRYTSDYLYTRKFNDATIDFYEYGLDIQSQTITIPIRDHLGGLVFVKKRFIKTAPNQNKYMNASGVPKQYILYGFYHVLQLIKAINNGTCTNKKLEENYKRYGIILTEGEFNTSYLFQNGYPASSLLGRILFEDTTRKTIKQKELLLRYGIRDLVIWMDNDDPGRDAKEKIYQQTYKDFRVRFPNYSQYPELNDANNYTPEQLDSLQYINP